MNYALLARHVAQAFVVGALAALVASGTTSWTFGVVKAAVTGGVVAAGRLLIETLSPHETVKPA